MRDDIRALLILQDRDRRLLAIAKDLERLPQDEARAKTKLAGDQAAVKAAHDAVLQGELELKRLELDTTTRKNTIARLKTQQFETRKNEEYQAIGHEITRYEKEVDALETKELELMEKIDSLRTAQKSAETALARTQGLVNEDLAAIQERQQRLKTEQEEVRVERERLAAAVPESVMPLYLRLMKSKDGLALAPMHDGKCEGCHMKLIASTVVAVQSQNDLVRCEDCGRFLYTEE